MTCAWCHEFTPPNRKDGYCSDICQIHSQRAEIVRLRDTIEHYKADAAHDERLIKELLRR